jgi:ribosomal peptide maturation radical SAM protein 1
MSAERPRVALVYAPFGACSRPALGISLLKSALARESIPCDIHYVNLMLARELGMPLCDLVALNFPDGTLFGEWLFAPALFGENAEADNAYVQQVLWGEYRDAFPPAVVVESLRIRERLPAFLDACLDRVDWSGYDWVGFSTFFLQHCASLALARRIKSRFPHVRIIFGGANCFGVMGATLCRLFPFIDFVCTGYGDTAFPRLVQAVADGEARPSVPGILARDGDTQAPPAIADARVEDLDALPYPDYSDYIEQLKTVDPPLDCEMRVPMETSRGCWWADVSRCTFCGFNVTGVPFHCKSPQRILDELHYLGERYGRSLFFADSVMAGHLFQTIVPELARQQGFSLAWEVRPTLTREQVRLLAQAGVGSVQPGIESLSDPILKLMRKGTTLAHNIQILKWAKEFGIQVVWNLLWGFPGEDPAEYAAMARLIPHLTHLDPPTGFGHIRFDRYSAYLEEPASFGITRLKPVRAYRAIYHSLAEDDLRDLAVHFDAEYADVAPLYRNSMDQAVRAWLGSRGARLDVFPSAGSIHIVDTRQPGTAHEYRFDGLAAQLYLLCDAAQTVRALLAAPSICGRASEAEVVALLDQFVGLGLMIHPGGQYLSLAVTREAGSAP